MARRLSYSARYTHPADKVYSALASRDMWDARMKEFRKLTPQSEIVEFISGDEGLSVTLLQTIPRTQLPAIAQTVMKKDMVITRKESLGPLAAGTTDAGTGGADGGGADGSSADGGGEPATDGRRAEGTYTASIPAGPGSLNGWQELFDTETGSTNRRTTEVKVFLPFINGKLEQLMLVNLVDLFRSEAEFTAGWIDENL
ncbi:hypothetical protein GCM10027169_06620 [Gordonia jinhuaensis]|uniref:Uncharacterized protein n=1 Tax=Gordonia jinhuaensis TaxID=1517702 RepID=A0A916SXN3_9ACTN|nr:DUF2505 domain-containing protein [Gordonia jinhuaensis]GGB20856.1 hypothetical protein GCM10011489_06220 [Gordonia jinhuaensis]